MFGAPGLVETQMGWLRDYMNSAHARIASFGQLAELCLNSPQWPRESLMKPRSLSTLFSKLDHEEELDWLRERPGVQSALARILGRPLSDLRAAIEEPAEASDTRYLRLRDVPQAREMDLAREELPPGIPRRLQNPWEWSPTLWIAPNGSGRSLFGRYLRLRGRAQHLELMRSEELPRIESVHGPLFVECHFPVDLTFLSHLDLRSRERPLCIAAPDLVTARNSPSFDPRIAQVDLGSETASVVSSDDARLFIGELAAWVNGLLEEKLRPSGGLLEARVRLLMQDLRCPLTLGDAFGGITLALESGWSAERGPYDLVKRSFLTRLKDLLRDAPLSPKTQAELWDRLEEASARAFTFGSSLCEPKDEENWIDLFSRETDDAGSPPLKGKSPRTAFDFVRLLAQSRVLVPEKTEGRKLALAPRFFATVLSERASDAALRLSPSDWGAATFQAEGQARVLRALVELGRGGTFSPIEKLLLSFDEDLPEHVAALECALVAVAQLRWEGHRVPDDLVDEIVEHALSGLVLLEFRLEPRYFASSSTDPARELFLSAWLELSFDHASCPPAYHLRECSPAMRSEWISCCLAQARRIPARLSLGLLRKLSEVGPLFRDLASEGTPLRLTRASVETFCSQLSLEHLLEWLTDRGQTRRAIWQSLYAVAPNGLLPTEWLEAHDPDTLKEAIRNCPLSELSRRLESGEDLPFEDLLPHQVAALVESHPARLPHALIERLPEEWALAQTVEQLGQLPPETTLTLLPARHFPLTDVLDCWSAPQLRSLFECSLSLGKAGWLSAELPDEKALLRTSPETLTEVRRFLLAVARMRSSGSAHAHELLTQIDQSLRPLHASPKRQITAVLPP